MRREYHLSKILKMMQNIYHYYLDLDEMDKDNKQEYLDAFEYVLSMLDGDLNYYGDYKVAFEGKERR